MLASQSEHVKKNYAQLSTTPNCPLRPTVLESVCAYCTTLNELVHSRMIVSFIEAKLGTFAFIFYILSYVKKAECNLNQAELNNTQTQNSNILNQTKRFMKELYINIFVMLHCNFKPSFALCNISVKTLIPNSVSMFKVESSNNLDTLIGPNAQSCSKFDTKLGSEMIDNLNIKTKIYASLLAGSLTVFASQPIRTRSSKSNIFVFMLRLPIISDPSRCAIRVLLYRLARK